MKKNAKIYHSEIYFYWETNGEILLKLLNEYLKTSTRVMNSFEVHMF